jgi:hypothetical protein
MEQPVDAEQVVLRRKPIVLYIVLIAALSAIFACGGTYFFVSRQPSSGEATLRAQVQVLEAQLAAMPTTNPTPASNSIPTPSPAPSPEASETAQWSTYTNTNGYSIRYSPTRVVSRISRGDGDGGPNDPGQDGTVIAFLQDMTQPAHTLSISVVTCETNQTLAEVRQNLVSNNADNGISSSRDATVGGKEAYAIQVTEAMSVGFCGDVGESRIPDGEMYGSPVSITAVPDGKKVFVFVNSPATDADGVQMLSTVRFAP